MARRSQSYDSLYTSAHLHNFQPTETLRDTMAKKDEDADLVVEMRNRRTLRSRQLQHGGLTYSCWNSLGAMEKVPSMNNGQRWSDVVAVINVRSAAVDVGRCRESTTTAAVVVQVPVQLMSDRLVRSADSALLFCLCIQNHKFNLIH